MSCLLSKLRLAGKSLWSHGFSSGFSSLGFLLGLMYSFNKHLLSAFQEPGTAGLQEGSSNHPSPTPGVHIIDGEPGGGGCSRVRSSNFEAQLHPSLSACLCPELPGSVRLSFFIRIKVAVEERVS